MRVFISASLLLLSQVVGTPVDQPPIETTREPHRTFESTPLNNLGSPWALERDLQGGSYFGQFCSAETQEGRIELFSPCNLYPAYTETLKDLDERLRKAREGATVQRLGRLKADEEAWLRSRFLRNASQGVRETNGEGPAEQETLGDLIYRYFPKTSESAGTRKAEAIAGEWYRILYSDGTFDLIRIGDDFGMFTLRGNEREQRLTELLPGDLNRLYPQTVALVTPDLNTTLEDFLLRLKLCEKREDAPGSIRCDVTRIAKRFEHDVGLRSDILSLMRIATGENEPDFRAEFVCIHDGG